MSRSDSRPERAECFLGCGRTPLPNGVCYRCWWALPSGVRHSVHQMSNAAWLASIAKYRRRRAR